MLTDKQRKENIIVELRNAWYAVSEFETWNELIHAYNIWCMPPAWLLAQETGEIVCTQNRKGTQPWKRKYGY